MDTGTRSRAIIARCPEPVTPYNSPQPATLEMDCSTDEQASTTQNTASAVSCFWEAQDYCNLPEHPAEMDSSPESQMTDVWDEYDAYGIFNMDDFSRYQTAMECRHPPAIGLDYRPFPACDDVGDHSRTQCVESTMSRRETDGHAEYAPTPHTDNRPAYTPENGSCSVNVLMPDGNSFLDTTSDTSRLYATPQRDGVYNSGTLEMDGVDENSRTPEACPEHRPEIKRHVCPAFTATPKVQLTLAQSASDTFGRLEHELIHVDRYPHHPDTQVHSPGWTRVALQKRPRHLKSRGPRSCRSSDPRSPYSRRRRGGEGEVDLRPDLRDDHDPGQMTRRSGEEPPVLSVNARLQQLAETKVVFKPRRPKDDTFSFSRQD